MSENDDVSRLIQTAKNTLAGSSKLVAKLMEGKERKQQLKNFEKIMADLCRLGEGHKNVCAALDEVKKAAKKPSKRSKGEDESTSVDDGEGSPEGLLSVYKSKLAALQGGPVNVAEHPDMMAFKTVLREVLSEEHGADEDEDVVFTAAEVNIHDPFTRQIMVDPVKNVKCGHSYERATIEAVISRRPTKCPCQSCPNRTEVRLVDLEPDERLRKHLEMLRASAETEDSRVADLEGSVAELVD